jgi:hypothetical protein
VGAIAAACAGCAEPVREDRTVTWSAQGDSVGFQHGDEGVLVADREGQGLERVYQPGPDVVATSTPLWSPTDGRLIFTTARDPQQKQAPTFPRLTQGDAAGDMFAQMPVIYTCWLREDAKGAAGQLPEPRPLFEAACDHVGYVAANLAVRWHPSGNQVLFIDQVDSQHHGLFAYDLTSGEREQVFAETVEALVFDWCPDNQHLACVLGSTGKGTAGCGIWIGQLDTAEWWHVPESEALAPAVLGSTLERLKASRPAWSRDGGRFVFVSAASTEASAYRSQIWLGDPTTRQVRLVAECDEMIDDLAWSPDGQRLGLVRRGECPSLSMLTLAGEWLPRLEEPSVRRFVGWDASGRSIAYVTAGKIPLADEESWALLLTADPQSRDAVFIKSGDGTAAAREVVSGLRVTFPRWSPREEKLSLWFTFSPSHRSWLSRWLGWGLLPGDPAAIVDVATGRVDWMAINPWEEAQVGHYHLLKRDYAEAWRRYERAAKEPVASSPPATLVDFFGRLQSPREIGPFEYVCLRKLGRDDEADQRLTEFRQRFPPDLSKLPASDGNAAEARQAGTQPIEATLRELFAPDGLGASLLQDLYVAEACLSVDAPEEAEFAFRRRMTTDQAEMASLSAAIVLAQLLLLEQRHDEYVDLAVDVIIPAVHKSWRMSAAAAATWPSFDTQGVLVLASGLTLLPLACGEFLADVDEPRVAPLAELLEELRPRAPDDLARGGIDAALVAAYQRLKEGERASAAQARFDANPVAAGWAPAGDLSGRIAELRRELQRWSRTGLERRR